VLPGRQRRHCRVRAWGCRDRRTVRLPGYGGVPWRCL